MPVIKKGKKWVFNGEEFDSENAANLAYKAHVALKFGIKEEKED